MMIGCRAGLPLTMAGWSSAEKSPLRNACGEKESLLHGLLGLPGALVVETPEGLVFAVIFREHYRTSQPGPELVAAQPVLFLLRRSRGQLEVQEVVSGVRGVVSQKLVEGAMKLVGPRF